MNPWNKFRAEPEGGSEVVNEREIAQRLAKRVSKRGSAFAMLPLEWVARASKCAHSPRTAVIVWLAYLAWETRSTTFPLPNGRLEKLLGVGRRYKQRTLLDLERGGMITVERRPRKTPIVTLLDWKLR